MVLYGFERDDDENVKEIGDFGTKNIENVCDSLKIGTFA